MDFAVVELVHNGLSQEFVPALAFAEAFVASALVEVLRFVRFFLGGPSSLSSLSVGSSRFFFLGGIVRVRAKLYWDRARLYWDRAKLYWDCAKLYWDRAKLYWDRV